MSIRDKLLELDAALREVATIDGVSVDSKTTPYTVRVAFQKAATDEQRAAAQALVNSFGWTEDPAADVISAIVAERDRRQDTGGWFAGGYWFPSEAKSRSQYLGLLISLLAGKFPEGILLDTLDGGRVPATPALVQEILQSATVAESTISELSTKAIEEAKANPEKFDLDSIAWPKAYWDK